MNYLLYCLALFIVLLNCNSKKVEISQVDFEADGCFGECPVFKMSIVSDGTASYHAEMFNKLEGHFTAIIQRPQLDTLISLIDKAHLLSLENNYSTFITDQSTYTLKVKLKDGQTKTIEDYGPSGPEKLKQVYTFILSLRESQSWK